MEKGDISERMEMKLVIILQKQVVLEQNFISWVVGQLGSWVVG